MQRQATGRVSPRWPGPRPPERTLALRHPLSLTPRGRRRQRLMKSSQTLLLQNRPEKGTLSPGLSPPGGRGVTQSQQGVMECQPGRCGTPCSAGGDTGGPLSLRNKPIVCLCFPDTTRCRFLGTVRSGAWWQPMTQGQDVSMGTQLACRAPRDSGSTPRTSERGGLMSWDA